MTLLDHTSCTVCYYSEDSHLTGYRHYGNPAWGHIAIEQNV